VRAHVRTALASFCLLVTLAGCDDKKNPPAPVATANTASAAPSQATSAASAAASGSAAPAAPGAARAFAGTYSAIGAGFFVPRDKDAPNAKDWKDVKWQGNPGDAGVGDGALKIAVSPEGVVTGEIEGPLGPAAISGSIVDDDFSASFRRKTAEDDGFSGTLSGKVAGDKIDGTLTASFGNASLIRSGKFSLAKK
jgi:hypothetical protein